jgi:hypothetical protein
LTLAANSSAADQRWPVICQDGDKHLTRLTETALGTPGAHEVTDPRPIRTGLAVAEAVLSFAQMLSARDLAVEIHHGEY